MNYTSGNKYETSWKQKKEEKRGKGRRGILVIS